MKIALRPAASADFDFCRCLYVDLMRPLSEEIFPWDEAGQDAHFARQFKLEEVQIITAGGRDVGWLQTQKRKDEIFLGQLYVVATAQNRGIGSHVIAGLLAAARAKGQPVTLGVLRNNRARGLYERFGFRVTGEDENKYYMRWDGRAADVPDRRN